MGILSRAADLGYAFRFLKLLTTKWENLPAYELGIIDKRGRNIKKAKELRDWLSKNKKYEYNNEYTYAGYNPPWTIHFLRRNEVLIQLKVLK